PSARARCSSAWRAERREDRARLQGLPPAPSRRRGANEPAHGALAVPRPPRPDRLRVPYRRIPLPDRGTARRARGPPGGRGERACSPTPGAGLPAALALPRGGLCPPTTPTPLGEVSYALVRPRGALVFTYHCDLTRQRALLPVYAPLMHGLFRRADALHTTS